MPTNSPEDRSLQPDFVFHYTSMENLLNIVETQCLWATSINYLNDLRERELFLSLAGKRLPELQKTGEITHQGLAVIPDSTNPDPDFGPLRRPFVTSFSGEGDSLLHWRAYCPQQNGVAIGFRTICLKEAQIRQKPEPGMLVPKPMFSEVMYLSPSNTPWVDSQMKLNYTNAKSFVASNNSSGRLDSDLFLQFVFQRYLETTASFTKHHSFESEKEYRVLISDLRSREDATCFRASKSCLIPYVPLIIPNTHAANAGFLSTTQTSPNWDAIATVVIGPTPNAVLSAASVGALFASKGVDVPVSISDVPYRDW
jgi:hypothetical protein